MTQQILIIEDDRDIIDLLRDLLYEACGDQYEVVWGNDGAGLVMAITTPPALIILDLMMHPVDGERILLHLRADPGTAEVPVIILSAKPGASAIATRYTRTTFIGKPFENVVFQQRVRETLDT